MLVIAVDQEVEIRGIVVQWQLRQKLTKMPSKQTQKNRHGGKSL
jgi:hypothetical protein